MSGWSVFTDGACLGNPGPGGWAAVLVRGGERRELTGGAQATTNNRMELTAAIEALETLPEGCDVTVWTDSRYLRDGITRWIRAWKRNGWRTADRRPVKNAELWRRLDEASASRQVEWAWIRGHAGNRENEAADTLARRAARRFVR